MRTILIIVVIFIQAIFAKGQNPNYDSTLAKTLGADEYGMKQYVMVILKTGSNVVEEKVKRDSLFAGHFKNINRLAELGKLVVAGPFEKNDKTYRGIFILNTTSFDEANELLQSDPTIKEKVFETELFHWYGSAALSEHLKIHKNIEKNSIH